MNARHTDAGRTDATSYEPSPSCGTFETAVILHAPKAHAVGEDTTMYRESSIEEGAQ
jgi:hypothetical protein